MSQRKSHYMWEWGRAHENGRVHDVKVFWHCSAVSTHGSAVEKYSVSSAWLLRARKRMIRVSPLTLWVQRHI